MQAFILAGGFATRLWPLTEKRAKPLLPLAGKPMLSHIVEGLPASMSVFVSTNAAFENAFKEWAQTSERKTQIIVEKTRSDDEKLGALGAVAQWLETTDTTEDVLLLTGDNYFGFRMDDFLSRYDGKTPLLAAYDIGDAAKASAFGTIILKPDSKRIAAFEEKPSQPKTTLVSTGCSVLPARTLPILREHARKKPDNVGGLFEEMLVRGEEIDCFTFKEPWFDVGSFDAYLEATKALVGDAVRQGAGTTMAGTHCEGSVVVGDRCVIKNCRLRDAVVFDGCNLEDCVLENCVIDEGCALTHADLRGKMIRGKTILEGRPTGLPA